MLQSTREDQGEKASNVISQADQLISEIEKQLAESDQFLVESGIDKKRLIEKAGPKQLREAQALFERDIADIEQEVSQAQARSSFSQIESRPKSFSRSMI